MLKVDGVLVGGEKIYRGRFKHWCAEFSMVCWWVGKKEREEHSNIGVLKLDGVLVGGEKRYRGGFKHWCAEFSMVFWLVGKKDIEELSNIGVLSF